MLPTSLGLMLPEFEASERHVAIGVWAATGGVAATAGPPLGGLLVQADWRLVFLVNVPVGLTGLALGWRLLAERREADAGRPDVLGALALIVAIGALVVAIVQGRSWGWGSPGIVALLAATTLLLPAIWWRSGRHDSPVVDPVMLRVRSFSLAVGASVLFFGGFAAMLLTCVLFLTTVWHEDVLRAGLMLSPGPILAAAFSVPSALEPASATGCRASRVPRSSRPARRGGSPRSATGPPTSASTCRAWPWAGSASAWSFPR